MQWTSSLSTAIEARGAGHTHAAEMEGVVWASHCLCPVSCRLQNPEPKFVISKNSKKTSGSEFNEGFGTFYLCQLVTLFHISSLRSSSIPDIGFATKQRVPKDSETVGITVSKPWALTGTQYHLLFNLHNSGFCEGVWHVGEILPVHAPFRTGRNPACLFTPLLFLVPQIPNKHV